MIRLRKVARRRSGRNRLGKSVSDIGAAWLKGGGQCGPVEGQGPHLGTPCASLARRSFLAFLIRPPRRITVRNDRACKKSTDFLVELNIAPRLWCGDCRNDGPMKSDQPPMPRMPAADPVAGGDRILATGCASCASDGA